MSNIPSLRQKIQQEAVNPQSPVSQYLFNQVGGAVNSILDGLKIAQSFTTPTSTTWTVDVENFLVFMCGGGGGGGSGDSDFGSGGSAAGGGGGSGSLPIFIPMFNQTIGASISLTVGDGGAGGVGAGSNGNGSNGANGQDTVFADLICSGGFGGVGANSGAQGAGGSSSSLICGSFLASGGSGASPSNSPAAVAGQRTIYALGGTAGTVITYNGPGGGGGAGFGVGGNGGTSAGSIFNAVTGGDAANNSGGGGGGSGGGQSTSRGGNGGSGFVYILYF